MTTCMECAHPWGVILERGEEITPEKMEQMRQGLIEELINECWEYGYGEIPEPEWDYDKFPKVRATTVLYVTEGLVDFMDRIYSDTFGVEAGWWDTKWCDVPAWLWKGRKMRPAILWDCCNIGFEENYVVKQVVSESGIELPV